MIKSIQSSTPADPLAMEDRYRSAKVRELSKSGLSSASLLNGQASVSIDHEGTVYVLRATKTGKLILTK